MRRTDFDIAICGAGPVGCVLALLLERYSSASTRIALFGQNKDTAAQQLDPRTIALNHGSAAILKQLNAWPSTQAPIHTVHVSQKGRLGRTLITPTELDVPYLGYVVNYDDLIQKLRQTIHHRAIEFIEVNQPAQVQASQNNLIHADHNHYYSTVCVVSDGKKPTQLHRDYNQHALLATVQSSLPKAQWAYERFTADGPLALLPHPNQSDCYAVVWCTPPERSNYLKSLPPTQFETELLTAFGARLGQLKLVSDRFEFPLGLWAGSSLLSPYTAAIGNAAQTLHPVAGQGLNLGLRDAGQLALCLRSWLANPHQDARPFLQHFASQRQPDRWVTGAVTDTLPRLFSSANPLVQHACGLGLLSMDLIATIRFPLARQLLQGLRI